MNYIKNIDFSQILAKLLANKKAYLLSFRVWGDGTEWMDTFLPHPNIVKKLDDNSYLIGYLIDGYFLTEKNQKFLRDVIDRFILTLENAGAVRVEWLSWINLKKLVPENEIYFLRAYKLNDLAPYLDSLNSKKTDYRALELLASCTEYKSSDDAFFDWLRFKVYDFVNINGKSALTLDYVRELAKIGYEIMGHKKGISTPLSKAKAIYNWVIENYQPKRNNWNYQRKTKNDEELKMTRREIALKNSKMRIEKTKNKVYRAIEELKRGNEKITVRKVATLAQVSKDSASKYIKQAKEEGLI